MSKCMLIDIALSFVALRREGMNFSHSGFPALLILLTTKAFAS